MRNLKEANGHRIKPQRKTPNILLWRGSLPREKRDSPLILNPPITSSIDSANTGRRDPFSTPKEKKPPVKRGISIQLKKRG